MYIGVIGLPTRQRNAGMHQQQQQEEEESIKVEKHREEQQRKPQREHVQ